MTHQDRHRNVPAQRKRITRELLLVVGAAFIAGLVAGAAKLEFWSSVALTAVILLAVELPLAIAAKRERDKDPRHPEA
jgi:hypothetical protein